MRDCRPNFLRRFLRAETLEQRLLLTYGAPDLVSVNNSGAAAGNGASYLSEQTLSADGRYYVFESDASDIVANDSNGTRDVFLKDIQLGTVQLISRTAAGAAANKYSDAPSISADGLYVAFSSSATNLDVTGVNSNSGFRQVYRWSRATGATTLISLNGENNNGAAGDSNQPTINNDGSRIAYWTYATDVINGVSDQNGNSDVYLRDLLTGTSTLVSHAAAFPMKSGDGYAFDARLSRDGSSVVYRSTSQNLQAGVNDHNNGEDLFSYNVSAGTNQYVSLQTTAASTANAGSSRTKDSLSANGVFEVFTSAASDLVAGDNNGVSDVFLRDLSNGHIQLVSRGTASSTANSSSDSAVISSDGEYVAFASYATNLDVAGTNASIGYQNIYRWQRTTGTILLVSVNSAGVDGGNNYSYQPTISGDGSRIAFHTYASDFVAGLTDSNGDTDVYLRNLAGGGSSSLVSHASASPTTTANGYATDARISRDGSTILYRSTAKNLQAGVSDANNGEDLIAYKVVTGTNQYVSLQSQAASTANAASTRTENSLSADGVFEVFTSSASDLVAGDTNGSQDVFLRNLNTGQVQLVSRGAAGVPANSSSDSAVISADGAFVAFSSYATNLDVTGANGITGYQQIYRWQRATGMLSLVSVNPANSDGGNNYSYQPSISADGSRVVYHSYATDLITGMIDNNNNIDVFLRNFAGAGSTVLVSHSSASATTTGNGYSHDARISRNGAQVVYLSSARDLQAGVSDINFGEDLFAFDVGTGANQYVSLESAVPSTGNAASSRTKFSLSADGMYEVFSSGASDLVGGDTNGTTDVFLRNLSTGSVQLISRTSGGASANSYSDSAVISANGEFVAFTSYATDLDVTGPKSTIGYQQVYRWERATGKIILVSVNAAGTEGGNNYSYVPTINGDGTRVAYESYAGDLLAGAGVTDGNGLVDIYLRDLATGTTRLVSHVDGNVSTTAAGGSSNPVLSRDGSMIVFTSNAANMPSGIADTNNTWDLFSYQVATQIVTAISLTTAGTATGNNGASLTNFSLSETGQFVAFESRSSDLNTLDTSTNLDVFVRDRVANTTQLISVNAAGTASANSDSGAPSVSGSGRYVAFHSFASDLDSADINGNLDVYVRDRTAANAVLVSLNAAGIANGNNSSQQPRMSFDGSTIVFESYATDLDAAITSDTNGERDIFARNWNAAIPVTSMLSRQAASSTNAGNLASFAPEVSDTGSRIVYDSNATDLAAGFADMNGAQVDIFAFAGGVVSLVTSKASGLLFSGNTQVDAQFDLSNDGNTVAFSSSAIGLLNIADGSVSSQVYVRNLTSGAVERVSVANAVPFGNSTSSAPSISGDGRYVAFHSFASNLSPLDTAGNLDIYVRDRMGATTTLISVNAAGTVNGDNYSQDPRLSNDGNTIVFQSYATNLDGAITSDVNGDFDVFLRNWTASTPVTTLVSKRAGSSTDSANRGSYNSEVSDNGSRVVFDSSASNLVAGFADVNGAGRDVFAFNAGTVTLVSAKAAGLFTGNTPVQPGFDLSNDGNIIAFSSNANGLIAETDGVSAIQTYVRNLTSNVTERVSIASGVAYGNSNSYAPSISGDGRYVAFESYATDLSPLDPSFNLDVYVRDRVAATTTLVSVNSSGSANANNYSSAARISNDGSTIAFESYATDLDAAFTNDNNSELDVFVRNWNASMPTTKMVSKQAGSSTSAANRASQNPEISDNGSRTIFESTASNLVAGITDANGSDIDVFAFSGGTVALVSQKAAGLFAGNRPVQPGFGVNNDGNLVVFFSNSVGLIADTGTSPYTQVYVRNMTTGFTELVSVNDSNVVGDYYSDSPSISGDGRYVTFQSRASNFSPLATSFNQHVYARDRIGATTILVSVNSAGTAGGDNWSYAPRISNDGNTIAFQSYASDLASTTDNNGDLDIFARNWRSSTPVTQLLSHVPTGTTSGNQRSESARINDNGTLVAFTSFASNLTSIADTNNTQDVFASHGIGLAVNSIEFLEGDSGTTDAVFTIELLAPSSMTVTVGYSTLDGTATVANNDYVAASGSLTFLPGETKKTVTVLVNGDVTPETNETFSLLLSNPVNAEIANGIGQAKILNDDTEISIADARVIEGNSGTSNLVFTVKLSVPSLDTVTVDFATSDLSATLADNDYQSLTGTISFVPGTTTKTISVQVNGDVVREFDELMRVTLFNAVHGIIVDGIADGLIQNDDTSLSINSVAVVEGNSGNQSVGLVVTLSHPSALPVSVQYSTADGSATLGDNDYLATSNTLTFAPGETSKSFFVEIVGDTKPEAHETVLVNLSNPANAGISIGQGVITILNDDSQLSVSDVAVIEGNSGTIDASFVVSLSQPSSSIVTVQVQTANGSATAGSDYVALGLTTITFNPGEISKIVSVAVNGDTTPESDESFFLLLSNPTNAIVAKSTGVATIRNDDSGITINDVAIVEGNSGTVVAVFTISLTQASALPVTVQAGTLNGTATAGTDYTGIAPTTISFAPGETSKSFSVTVFGDTDVEAFETFFVDLSSPSNATIVNIRGTGTIQNDDAAFSISAASVLEGNSGTTTMQFSVFLLQPVVQVVTVQGSTSDGTAMAGTDYTAVSGQLLTFNPGQTFANLDVTIFGDTDAEPHETFTATLSAPSGGAILSNANATGTILNDDARFSIANASVTEGDSGTQNMSFVVALAQPVAFSVSVDYFTTNNTAIAPADYTATSGNLFFSANVLTNTILVPIVGDNLPEANETFFVDITNPSSGSIAVSQAIGTIFDNDPVPSLSINDVTIVEGNAGTTNAVFTVTLSVASGQIVTVNYATANGSATAGADYTGVSGTLTFNPGTLTQTISVPVLGDLLDEIDETFFVDLSTAVNASISDNQGLGTITDDDAAPSLSINDVTIVEGNSGSTNAVFTVTLSAASGKTVTVNYATANGSATAGADYTGVSGTLTFNPGTLTQTISVPVLGDLLDEIDETFFVDLSTAVNATISDNQGLGTITDDDAAPSLSINDVTIVEGNSGSTNAVFTVTLSAASGKTVTVNYATANGSATAGADYTSVSGTLTFNPGTLTQTISVPVLGDLLNEIDETFFVDLSTAVNATLSDNQGLGTITDDDAAPSLSINDVTIVEGNSGSTNAVFTVTLSAASGKTVTVNYATANGSATAGSDYTAVSGILTFSPGTLTQTISVPVLGDLLAELDETFFVNLDMASNSTISDSQGIGTIKDDDGTPSLSINDVTIVEGNAGTTNAVFTVTLSVASGQIVTVNYATANGSATAGADYTGVSGTLTFNPGTLTQTISVPVLGDLLDEIDETFFVDLSTAVNATISDNQGLGTITDDDAAPSLSINDVTIVEGNSGSTNAVFTVTLSAASGKTVMVNFATANGSATAGADYTGVSGTLTFNPGTLPQTISVPVLGDLLDEIDETFFVDLSTAVNASISDNQGLGTITDDDAAPSLSINDVTIVEGNSGSTNAVFTVTLSAASGKTVTVNYATANDSATAGSDYTGISGTLTFDPGTLTQTISVPVLGDLLDENDETFLVDLSLPTNATLSDGQGIGTILNDEAPEVESIVVGDGTSQRSNVSQITVNFYSLVNIDNGMNDAVKVRRLAGTYGPAADVQVTLVPTQIGGKTSLAVRFTGALTRGQQQALEDGNYVLELNALRFTLANLPAVQLDGDKNGTGGDNYVYGTEAADNFFAMFGDIDGDRDVDGVDLAGFVGTYRKKFGDKDFNEIYDYNGNGAVDGVDLSFLNQRYRTKLGF